MTCIHPHTRELHGMCICSHLWLFPQMLSPPPMHTNIFEHHPHLHHIPTTIIAIPSHLCTSCHTSATLWKTLKLKWAKTRQYNDDAQQTMKLSRLKSETVNPVNNWHLLTVDTAECNLSACCFCVLPASENDLSEPRRKRWTPSTSSQNWPQDIFLLPEVNNICMFVVLHHCYLNHQNCSWETTTAAVSIIAATAGHK